MSQLANSSATSLNFIGFEEMKGQGMPEILYNQVFIEPNQSYTAGVGQIAAAGYVPGTQSYLKRRQAVWSQTNVGRQLSGEGFQYTSADAKAGARQVSERDGRARGLRPRPNVQGDESAYTHADVYVARGFFP